MTYYLYVPFKRKEVSARHRAIIEQWIDVEKEKRIDVRVCYSGEKTLNNLPPYAKVYVLFHGKAGKASPLSNTSDIPTELARRFESFSRHLRINDGKHSLLLPEVADKMVEDGLLTGFKGHLNIKLFFYDEDKKTALNLSKAFFNSLLSKPAAMNGNIKLDYYEDKPLTTIEDPIPITSAGMKAKRPKSKSEEFIDKAREPQYSFYSKIDSAPKLSVEHIALVIEQYNEYKSSRCCGLSGLLYLNGFFSSDASAQAIKYLTDVTLSQEKRFDFASKFLTNHPNNYFTQCLKSVVEESLIENKLIWDGYKPPSSNRLMSMGA